jgi:DNA-binding MarR family transcriptional regulator
VRYAPLWSASGRYREQCIGQISAWLKTMADDGGDRRTAQRNLAADKFNFLAWAARNGKRFKLGAVDLMVLVQLVVRYDPERGAFAMSAEALADRTGTAISSVRRSLRRLEKSGDIDVIPRPGRSSIYKVRFDRAPSGWIAREREDHEAERAKRNGVSLSRHGLPKSDKGPAKILRGRVPKSGRSPSQNLSAVSIPSNHSHSHIPSSMRPEGRKEEDAVALKEKKGGAYSDSSDAFDRFIEAWPKPDRDIAKLKGAWHKRVIRAGYDPEDVIASALEWRRYYLADPNYVRPPFAGQWLAQEGWLERPPRLSADRQEWVRYTDILAEAVKRLDTTAEQDIDGRDEFDDD